MFYISVGHQGLKVFKKPRMPYTLEIIRIYPVCLIFLRITFESIQTPVCKIHISLFEQLNQVLPRNVRGVCPKLSEKEWNSELLYGYLVLPHPLFKIIVAP